MRVITDKPIIYSETPPIVYSNASGPVKTISIVSDKVPVKAEKTKTPLSPDALNAGASVITGVAGSLLNRPLTDAENRCGKKPLTKKGREQWQKCVESGGGAGPTGAPTGSSVPDAPVQQPGMSKGMKIGLFAGGILVLGVIGYFVFKPKN